MGWSESEYLVEIMHHKSRLWQQLMTRRDGRTSSMRTAHKSLLKAWETGVANANNVGMRTREEIRADAVELAYIWSDRISERVDGLNPTEEAVMSYVIAETERRGMLRVTCPGRAVAEFAKTSHRTAARILPLLAKRGLPGAALPRPAGQKRKRKGGDLRAGRPKRLRHIDIRGIPLCAKRRLRRFAPNRGLTGY